MLKSMRKTAALAIALAAALPMTATPALATGISDARITKILWTGGRILVYFNVTHSVVCGCCGDRYETTVNDAASQARMALIMTAFAQQKSVYVGGTGNCSTTDSEWINDITIMN